MSIQLRILYVIVDLAWNQEWPPKRFWSRAIRWLDRWADRKFARRIRRS